MIVALFSPESRIRLPTKLAEDLSRFLQGLAAEGTYNPMSLNLDNPLAEIVARIEQAYALKTSDL